MGTSYEDFLTARDRQNHPPNKITTIDDHARGVKQVAVDARLAIRFQLEYSTTRKTVFGDPPHHPPH